MCGENGGWCRTGNWLRRRSSTGGPARTGDLCGWSRGYAGRWCSFGAEVWSLGGRRSLSSALRHSIFGRHICGGRLATRQRDGHHERKKRDADTFSQHYWSLLQVWSLRSLSQKVYPEKLIAKLRQLVAWVSWGTVSELRRRLPDFSRCPSICPSSLVCLFALSHCPRSLCLTCPPIRHNRPQPTSWRRNSSFAEYAAAESPATVHDDHQHHRRVGGQVGRRQSVGCRHRVPLGQLGVSTGTEPATGSKTGPEPHTQHGLSVGLDGSHTPERVCGPVGACRPQCGKPRK